MRDPFKVLGIEPTSDKKQIKKAYAKLAARYHPEEYSENGRRSTKRMRRRYSLLPQSGKVSGQRKKSRKKVIFSATSEEPGRS